MPHHRVLQLVVRAAVAVKAELLGERGHEGGACGEDDVAGGVEGMGDAGGGFGGGEEGHGGLMKRELAYFWDESLD